MAAGRPLRRLPAAAFTHFFAAAPTLTPHFNPFRSRAKRPGVPLREAVLSDDEYATDWESGAEDDAVSAAGAAADAHARAPTNSSPA